MEGHLFKWGTQYFNLVYGISCIRGRPIKNENEVQESANARNEEEKEDTTVVPKLAGKKRKRNRLGPIREVFFVLAIWPVISIGLVGQPH